MKKITMFLFLAICINGISGQAAESEHSTDVLFIYEENNKSINSWKLLFESNLGDKGYSYDVIEAPQIDSGDLSKYDYIIIHGAVMGFTLKEPVRNWLKSKPDLSGKKCYYLLQQASGF